MRPTTFATTSMMNTLHFLEEINQVQDQYTVCKYKKGDYVYMPDQASDQVFFLKTGRVTVGTFSGDGKIIAKSIVQTGQFFGEMGLIGENQRRDFALAKDVCEVWVFELVKMRRVLMQKPNFYMHLIKSIGKRLQKTEQRLESMVFKNSRTRIVEFLHRLGSEHGQRIGYETLVRHFYTHQEIANLTGTSRQTVTTTLNELRNNNVITFNRRRLLIRDLQQLVGVQA